jgi:dTDP-4-dehydrorhamnose 3,5-epimerase
VELSYLRVPDVLLIRPSVHEDERGAFMEAYQARKFAEAGITLPFVQDNQSRSRRGVLRGLHYQIRHPQGKLVRVLAGEVFDVAVDLRRASRTFGQWASAVLSSENRLMLWLPPGFAHGFYVLSEWAEVVYKATDYYAPEWERTLRWDDPALGIPWPLAEEAAPMLSPKDAAGMTLARCETYDWIDPPAEAVKP